MASVTFPGPESGLRNEAVAGEPSRGHPHQKRARTQLSCTHCRSAKLRCDRQQPCANCTKRNRASSCIFPTPMAKKKPHITMQKRLKHLESLLKDVMHGQTPVGQDTPPSDGLRGIGEGEESLEVPATISGTTLQDRGTTPEREENSGQVFHGAKERTSYVGATHWAAILDDIEEVKSYFNEAETEDTDTKMNIGPTSLLFGVASPSTKPELLDALPPRNIVDRLVSRYFNSNSPGLHIIHPPTFQKQAGPSYRDFWIDPLRYRTSFLGLLYAIMCLATFSATEVGSGEGHLETRGTPMEMIRAYRGYCIQCLVLSNYTNPSPHVLEGLLIYMEAEFVLSKADQMNCYLLTGLAVRLALRMGLHRDSDKVGGSITPFEGEMRRRHWIFIVQIDLLTAFHMGLPSMVHTIESDTQFPRNILDADFNENIVQLPPGRPLSEPTPMTYTIAKGKICVIFGKVAAQANLLSLSAYLEVMNLDQILTDAYNDVPGFLRPKPLDEAITDSPEVIIQRFSISMLYHKTRCVLHRKYLMKAKDNQQYSYSKKIALDSSMQLLHEQTQIHAAVQLGGPMTHDKWLISSLLMHDFLLAAMIVYLCVGQIIEENSGSNEITGLDDQQQHLIATLQQSHDIWMTRVPGDSNAKKASDVLAVMLKKIYSATGQPIDNWNSPIISGSGYAAGSAFMSSLSINDPVPRSDINPLPSSQPSRNDTPYSELGPQVDFGDANIFSTTPLDPLGGLIDLPMDFDWNTFDTHLRSEQGTADQPWLDLSLEDFHVENLDIYNL